MHPNCLIPPWTGPIDDDWSCHSCRDKTDEFFKARDQYVAELSKRYTVSCLYDISFPNRFSVIESIRAVCICPTGF